jgi:hypothetical protein
VVQQLKERLTDTQRGLMVIARADEDQPTPAPPVPAMA